MEDKRRNTSREKEDDYLRRLQSEERIWSPLENVLSVDDEKWAYRWREMKNWEDEEAQVTKS